MFKIGDTVTWTSQSAGSSKTKTGTVEIVVPAGAQVTKFELKERGYAVSHNPCFGKPRKHESYLVAVGNKIYWPRVMHLNKVEKGV